MGGRTWRLMHQGHSRGCAFLQFFLCLWGVSGIPGSICLGISVWPARCHCSKGKATPKAVRGLFRSCGTSSSGRKPPEGLGTHHGPCIGTTQCPPSPAHSVDMRGGAGCPGNPCKEHQTTCHKRSCRGLCKSPTRTGYHVEPTFQSLRPILGRYLMRYNSIS